jgi:anthranilate/para-aminobenzoate synthase component I
VTVQIPLPQGLPDTPRRAFTTLSAASNPFWLDSGDRPGEHARFHHLSCNPAAWFRCSDADPFQGVRAFCADWDTGSRCPIMAPRIVGFWSYDSGRHVEGLALPGPLPNVDDVALAVYDACVTYDMDTGRAWVTAINDDAAEQLCEHLLTPAGETFKAWSSPGPMRSYSTREQYAQQVETVQDYIAQGDVYQVNISHRFDVRLVPHANLAELYLNLRNRHPAPFGAFFDTGSMTLLSNSPECFLALDLGTDARTVTTWPLKGTLPSSSDPAELPKIPKERAEHVMIVDLERNDLGRVAVPGSVIVDELMKVVSYSTVHHLESAIRCTPRAEVDWVDVLAATFPGGSITGAPKIRAMEIIAEIEEEARGPYCGALGFVAHGGQQGLWNIPIRTAVVTNDVLSFRVGGGVVSDSDPDREYDETLTKARAFLEVLS